MPMRARVLPLVLLLTIAVVYGLLFQFNKLARDALVPELAYVFWQAALGGAILLVASYATGQGPGWSWAHIRSYLAIGFFGIAFPIWLLTNLAAEVDPGVLTTVLALSPPLTYVFSVLARLEKWRWLAVLGVVLGFSGILVIVGPSNALPAPGQVGWYLLALLAPAGFALANVSAALLRPPALSTVAMAAGILVGAAAMMAVTMAVTGTWYSPPAFPDSGDWAIIGAGLVNVVAICLFLEIIRMAGPVFFAQFNYLAVVASIFWAWIIFGSFVDWSVWVALAVMVAGVLLVTLTGPRGTPEAGTGAGEKLPADRS